MTMEEKKNNILCALFKKEVISGYQKKSMVDVMETIDKHYKDILFVIDNSEFIIWQTIDVICDLYEHYPLINNDDAKSILKLAVRNHDASRGLAWESFRSVLKELNYDAIHNKRMVDEFPFGLDEPNLSWVDKYSEDDESILREKLNSLLTAKSNFLSHILSADYHPNSCDDPYDNDDYYYGDGEFYLADSKHTIRFLYFMVLREASNIGCQELKEYAPYFAARLILFTPEYKKQYIPCSCGVAYNVYDPSPIPLLATTALLFFIIPQCGLIKVISHASP